MKNKKDIKIETSVESGKSSTKRTKRRRAVKMALLVVVHALGVGAIVGLSVALHFSQDKIAMQADYQRQMESVYAKAYYNLLDGVNDIDTTMAKLTVASTSEKQEALLYEIWCASALAEEYLATFENQDEGVMTAVKFVNQLGDFSLYLAGKLSKGEELTKEDKDILEKMRPLAEVLKESLQKVGKELDEGKLFVEENGVLASFADAFTTFNQPSIDYPEMIYDGPFSDALAVRNPKGLEGLNEITASEGVDIVNKLFENPADVKHIGRFEGDIPTENYSFSYKGYPAFVQLSSKGGKVTSFTLSHNVDNSETPENAGEVALNFASKMGYSGLEVVWMASSNGHTYVNLAPVADGIILYPDLVKVKIDGDMVVGFDSAHHIFNHRKRNLPTATITESEAEARLTVPPVREGRLALIPDGGEKETLCFEFECESDGTYFVYIDALTGGETEIFFVINDTDLGESLM